MEKGDVFVTKIHELAEQGYSKNAIARVANLSKPTISKILNDQYINKWRNLEEKRREKTKMYKEIWRKIYKENKHLSRTEISRMNRAAYVWLNKYNNEWLQKKLPPSRVGRIKKERQFNYIELSHSILDLLQNWPIYERNSGKLVRRTMNILYLELGISLKHCDKYKDIAEAVNSFLESTLDFRKRKIDYLLANEFRNKFVSTYIIAERVGIRAVIRNGNEELKEYLISKIDEHNK